MAIKSANVIARVDPAIKKEAEKIMSDLGLSVSTVINALYRQIIINQAIPFEMKKRPIFEDELTEEELINLLKERVENIKEEDLIPAEEVYKRLQKRIENDKRVLNSIRQRSSE